MNLEVKQYIENLPKTRQEFLMSVRKTILDAVPKIDEKFRYNMPYYEYNNKPFCSVASQKHYVSFYIFDKNILENNPKLVQKLDTGKCCVRFKRLDNHNDDSLKIIKKLLLISKQSMNNKH